MLLHGFVLFGNEGHMTVVYRHPREILASVVFKKESGKVVTRKSNARFIMF